jgi:dTDP-4-amino-4,6-dideoxygalactose transaminase
VSLRRLPPVHSPLSGAALLAGLRAASSPSAGRGAATGIERWLSANFSPSASLLTDSGTSALTLALTLAAPGGGRVALPAWGCYDLATACDGAGVEVLLYDLDPTTLGPDWTSFKAALEAGARAVVVVHFFGLLVNVGEVCALAGPYGATVIEDAAQGAGASLGGRRAGALGDGLGVLSFGRGKGITGGRGGALLGYAAQFTSPIAALATGLPASTAGWGELPKSLVQQLFGRPALYAIPAALPFLNLGETLYHPPHPAGSLPRSSAGILSETVRLADVEAARRRENAGRLRAGLTARAGLQTPEPIAGSVPGYLRLPVLGAAMGPRLGSDSLARGLGIMPGYPGTLAELPGFGKRIRNRGASMVGARELAARLGTLPTHAQLNRADLQRLEAWLVAAPAT